MKKIVYVISTLKKTGPTLVLFNLVKNLDLNKFKPVIVTLSSEQSDTMIEEFKSLNIDIFCINLNRIKGFIFGGFKIKKIIKRINPDIVHSHCFRSSLFSGLFLYEYKRIVTIHCDYKTDFIMAYGKFTGYIMYFLMHYSLKKIKNNICCSKMLADILNYRYHNMNFKYIDNGIDTEKFYVVDSKYILRQKLSLPYDKKIFIWIGAFIARKSPETLAKSISLLEQKNMFFCFCGEGKLKEKCKNMLSENKNVLFTGSVNNIDEYLKASDYYISTSFSEGLPNSVLEAMSCGLPVILSDIIQHRYVFKNVDCYYFAAGDSKDLCNKITAVSNNDYEKYSKESVNIVKNNFSASAMSAKYQNYYLIFED
ncbi:MAG: glycosyltransferase family 4 protein [Endomicrobiaceae bacterium]|nr:glycosyltransferase family 4 protein [Endomicrobiaceae bacterium]